MASARVAATKSCETCGEVYSPKSNRQRWCKTECRPRKYEPRPCENEKCDRIVKNGGRYCSRCSARIYRVGSLELPWREITPVLSPDGYPRVWVGKDSVHANAQGYAYCHRLVMAEHVGRPLLPEETVHHINGDKTDYRLENLELWAKNHGAGQRVDDLISHIVQVYPDQVLAAMKDAGLVYQIK